MQGMLIPLMGCKAICSIMCMTSRHVSPTQSRQHMPRKVWILRHFLEGKQSEGLPVVEVDEHSRIDSSIYVIIIWRQSLVFLGR